MALVVNFFGAPGSGKSTGAAYVFAQLKMRGVNAELVTEFAKDKVWEESQEALRNQAYVFGEQYFRISRCIDKVDVIITDSPLPLNVIYNTDALLGDSFDETVMEVFSSFRSFNYLLEQDKPYSEVGRLQTEEEAHIIQNSIQRVLRAYKVPYLRLRGKQDSYDRVVEEVLDWLKVK